MSNSELPRPGVVPATLMALALLTGGCGGPREKDTAYREGDRYQLTVVGYAYPHEGCGLVQLVPGQSMILVAGDMFVRDEEGCAQYRSGDPDAPPDVIADLVADCGPSSGHLALSCSLLSETSCEGRVAVDVAGELTRDPARVTDGYIALWWHLCEKPECYRERYQVEIRYLGPS